MKTIVIATSILIILVIIQFSTYQKIAPKKLGEVVIKNLKIEKNLDSDTILLNNIIETCGNDKNIIIPYNLHLNSNKNLQLLQNKNPHYTIINTLEYKDYCSKMVVRKFNELEPEDFDKVINNISHKPELSITAIESGVFIVNVTTNLNGTKSDFSNDESFLWIMFFWLKI